MLGDGRGGGGGGRVACLWGERQSYQGCGRDGWGVGKIVFSHFALSLWSQTELFLPLFRRSVVVL